jgi:hypothetical protein
MVLLNEHWIKTFAKVSDFQFFFLAGPAEGALPAAAFSSAMMFLPLSWF